MALPLIRGVCSRNYSLLICRSVTKNYSLAASLSSVATHATIRPTLMAPQPNKNFCWIIEQRRMFSKHEDDNIMKSSEKHSAHPSPDVSYEEFKALLHSKSIQVIDVRETMEIAQTGRIKVAVHVPLGELNNALAMEDRTFQAHYGGQKPQSWDRNIVFFGLGPIKSQAALEVAHKVGYNHVRRFAGGWEEWSKREVNRQAKKKAKLEEEGQQQKQRGD